MLDGDELLELAQETGYRLCHYPFETNREGENHQQQLVFSASWDVNPHHYRLFLCMQNGELKVIEFQEINAIHTFQIRFRHHVNNISDYHKTADKIIQLHFDKFSTVAGKDDEILFLLGISKAIYHTKLPDIIIPPPDASHEEEVDGTLDLLSQGKPPFYGYHLGSPVLELASHPTRVTALAVSWQGKYLASGDEAGHVKIVMLQTKDNMQQVITSELQRMQQDGRSGVAAGKLKELSLKSKTSTRSYLPKYDFTELLHDGPIFSLQWIHPTLTTDFNHSQGLLTGSLDRAVRLWGVSYSVSNGISVSPMMVFDTFSTHILSLHAFSSAMIAQRHQQPSSLSSSHPLLSATASQNRDNEAVSVTSSQDMFNRVAHYSFIFAGTNAGTLHIWKIYDKEVMTAYERLNRERFDSTSTKKTMMEVLDDGKKLVNLIQVSEYPIIHISTGSMITTLTSLHNSFNGNVLLSVSDVHGQVRIYGTEYQTGELQINEENVNEFFSSKSRDNYETNPLIIADDNYVIQKIRSRHEKEFPVSNRFNEDDGKNGQLSIFTGENDEMTEEDDVDESFTPLKEEFFESPVVACSFSNAPPSSHSSGQGSRVGGGGSSELAVVTMNAMIRLYNDVNEAKHSRSKVTEISLKSLSGRAPSLASLDPAASPALRSSPRLDKIDSAERLRDKILADTNSRKEILAAVSEDPNLCLSQQRLPATDDDMESRSSWHTSHYTRSDRGGSTGVGDEQVKRLYEKTMMRKKREEQESKTQADPSLTLSRKTPLSSSPNKQLRQSDEFDPKPRSAPPPKPILAHPSASPSSSPTRRKASFVTSAGDLNLHLTSSGQTITRRGSMMSVLTSQSGESRGDSGVKYEEVEYPASEYLNNSFSLPALQSSKILEAQIHKQYPFAIHASSTIAESSEPEKNHQQLESSLNLDDISVSTVHTTKSDLQYARQQVLSARRHPRYSALTKGSYFDEEDVSQVLRHTRPVQSSTGMKRQLLKSEVLKEVLSDEEKGLLNQMQEELSKPEHLFSTVKLELFFNHPSVMGSSEGRDARQQLLLRRNYNRESGLYSHLPLACSSNASFSYEVNFFDHVPLATHHIQEEWKDDAQVFNRSTDSYLFSLIR